MTSVHALVAEHTPDLIHTLQATHNKALQIELQGYAKLYILIQSVVMRFKGASRSAAGIGNQHGGLHLHETLAIQEIADLSENH